MSNQIKNLFANPALCQQLLASGLYAESCPFFYKVEDGFAAVYSFAFDDDSYYEQAMRNVEYANKKDLKFIQAFSIDDMQQMLPNYRLRKDGNVHTLETGAELNHLCYCGTSLADVFAHVILQALHLGYLEIKQCLSIINSK